MKYNQNDIEYLKKYIKENNLDNNYYNNCLKKLEQGKPIQYIIGNVDFYGNIIKVNNHVLIPRFETELLVDLTIKKINKYFPNQNIDILDLGTGSGCIAISLKKEINSNIDALDISKEALELAKQNAIDNHVDINFINKDMTTFKDKKYDIIISNPPYIPVNSKDVEDIVLNNEPSLALFSEDNGLYHYKKIIKEASNYLKNKKYLVFEIGHDQLERLTIYTKSIYPNAIIKGYKDLEGKDRILVIKLGE